MRLSLALLLLPLLSAGCVAVPSAEPPRDPGPPPAESQQPPPSRPQQPAPQGFLTPQILRLPGL